MKDLITIIVPVYNNELFIERCLESIINQTYTNLEIIIVNDGSVDRSLELCNKYKEYDDRVKIISQKNKGPNVARTTGINMAKGKYIGFVDSDDYIEKNMYEYLYNLILKNKADISICGHNIIKDNSVVDIVNCAKDVLILDKFKGLELIINDKLVNSFSWDKLFSRKLFEDFAFLKLAYHEDLGSIFKLFYKSETIVVGNKPMYNYVRNTESCSFNITSLKLYHSFLAYLERYNFMLENKINLKEKTFSDMIHAAITSVNAFIRKDELELNYEFVNKIIEIIRDNIFNILINKSIQFHCKIYSIICIFSMRFYKKIVKINILEKLKRKRSV